MIDSGAVPSPRSTTIAEVDRLYTFRHHLASVLTTHSVTLLIELRAHGRFSAAQSVKKRSISLQPGSQTQASPPLEWVL